MTIYQQSTVKKFKCVISILLFMSLPCLLNLLLSPSLLFSNSCPPHLLLLLSPFPDYDHDTHATSAVAPTAVQHCEYITLPTAAVIPYIFIVNTHSPNRCGLMPFSHVDLMGQCECVQIFFLWYLNPPAQRKC